MKIRSSYVTLTHQAATRIEVRQLGRARPSYSYVGMKVTSGASNEEGKVTISTEAIELNKIGIGAAPFRTPAQEKLLASFAADAVGAENAAYGMATIPSRVMYDISSGGLRLASTGQSMEDETVRKNYVKNFELEASAVDSKLLDIYNTEKAKGTNPAEIVAKMFDWKNSQSAGYLEATAWGKV
jgi:hypothetical protein